MLIKCGEKKKNLKENVKKLKHLKYFGVKKFTVSCVAYIRVY